MIKFSAATLDDRPQILEWTQDDPYHSERAQNIGPDWWITGSDSLLAACVEDGGGPVFYFRLDDDGDLVRLHIQFAPLNQVSKGRVARSIIRALPLWANYAKTLMKKGIVFESINPSLIKFGESLGFKPSLETPHDFVLIFQEI